MKDVSADPSAENVAWCALYKVYRLHLLSIMGKSISFMRGSFEKHENTNTTSASLACRANWKRMMTTSPAMNCPRLHQVCELGVWGCCCRWDRCLCGCRCGWRFEGGMDANHFTPPDTPALCTARNWEIASEYSSRLRVITPRSCSKSAHIPSLRAATQQWSSCASSSFFQQASSDHLISYWNAGYSSCKHRVSKRSVSFGPSKIRFWLGGTPLAQEYVHIG